VEGSLPWKVVLVLTFTLHILNNIVINRFIFLKDVRVELFPTPPKLPGCDFKQWIDDYMTPKDIEYVTWVGTIRAAMSKSGSSSKYSGSGLMRGTLSSNRRPPTTTLCA
jgi:hypothetical protein